MSGAPPDGPIFIGGLSGSGKTQLRVALGAHPDLSLTRRTGMWTRFYGRFGDLSVASNLDRCLSVLVHDPRVQLLEPEPFRIRREFAAGPPSYARLFGVLHRQHAQRSGKRRWGDQLGFVECFASRIFVAFPSARMIHMVRDPRRGYSRERTGKLGWDIAMWLHSAESAETNSRRYKHRYRVVQYEDFAASPLSTVEDLCRFLGEDFVDDIALATAALRFDRADAAPADAPAARHRHRSRVRASFVEAYAGRQLAVLGYAPNAPRLSPREQLAYLGDWPVNRTTMAAWRAMRRRPLEQQRLR
jgi:hypothetical protein